MLPRAPLLPILVLPQASSETHSAVLPPPLALPPLRRHVAAQRVHGLAHVCGCVCVCVARGGGLCTARGPACFFFRPGSGKTLGFALPILATLKGPEAKGFRAVVLSPTRELAAQVRALALSGPA